MAESLGGDQGFRVDQDGQGPDQGEDGQQGGGDQGDRALHQMAVGGKTRFKGDGSEESEDKGQESLDPVITFPIHIPFQVADDRQGRNEGKQSNEGNKWDAVVADEGKDEGQGDEAEENMGEEIN